MLCHRATRSRSSSRAAAVDAAVSNCAAADLRFAATDAADGEYAPGGTFAEVSSTSASVQRALVHLQQAAAMQKSVVLGLQMLLQRSYKLLHWVSTDLDSAAFCQKMPPQQPSVNSAEISRNQHTVHFCKFLANFLLIYKPKTAELAHN
jgi:hypothetical protein